MKVYFIGAGPGDPELITLKGKRIMESAGVIVYAGSLVNPEILKFAHKDALVFDSAPLSLEEIMGIMIKGIREGKIVARLHTGDPSLYGAIREQMEILKTENIEYEIVPGVSSFLAAAAAIKTEFTIPELSQSVIITRMTGRTEVPAREKLSALARHQTSMVIFLSISLADEVEKELRESYPDETPVAIAYKISWPEQFIVRGELKDLSKLIRENHITKTALIIIGKCLNDSPRKSKLYDKDFAHGYRKK